MTTTATTATSQGPAQGRYSQLEHLRTAFLNRGRLCSQLTIPALLPPSGFNSTTPLATPWQSLGSRGVNNLAAKLLLTLFPPNSPFFRYSIDDFTLQQLTQQKGLRAEVEKALSSMERAIMTEVETTAMRPSLNEALKHLVVSGNVLLHMMPSGGLRVFRLDQYVAKRSPSGSLLEAITHEKISAVEIPAPVRAQVQANARNGAASSVEDTYDLFTHIQRDGGQWRVHQEVCGVEVPGSRGTYPDGKLPWLPLRFITIDGEDYGRGYVEELLGDLRSLEALQKAIVQGSAAAAKVLFLVKPNGSTKIKVLTESESGDVKVGNADDVTVLQMQKYNDFKVALEMRADLTKSLSYAFMLHSAVQRDAERLTAEEIRYMANELEAGLGGIYSTMSQELQLPVVTLLSARLTLQGRLPQLPTEKVRPVITTGVEAIGRGNDVDKMTRFFRVLKETLGEQAVGVYVNVSDGIERLGAGMGIDTDGLIRSAEEVEKMQQQNQLQALAERLGPEAIKQLGQQSQPQ